MWYRVTTLKCIMQFVETHRLVNFWWISPPPLCQRPPHREVLIFLLPLLALLLLVMIAVSRSVLITATAVSLSSPSLRGVCPAALERRGIHCYQEDRRWPGRCCWPYMLRCHPQTSNILCYCMSGSVCVLSLVTIYFFKASYICEVSSKIWHRCGWLWICITV